VYPRRLAGACPCLQISTEKFDFHKFFR
jgi:hypothetical protein